MGASFENHVDWLWTPVIVCAVVSAVSNARGQAPQPEHHAIQTPSQPAQPAQIDEWIGQLSDETYAVREYATAKLLESGLSFGAKRAHKGRSQP
jgi:hypothetical protein